MIAPDTDTAKQVVSFTDESEGFTATIEGMSDPSRLTSEYVDATLADFLSRPVKLFDEEWAIGTTYSKQFNPDDYLLDPRVKSKIDNFHLISFDMHVKVIINATPFHYSKLFMAALPDPRRTAAYSPQMVDSQVLKMCRMTQLLHVKSDLNQSDTMELQLPFINRNNYTTLGETQDVGRDPIWTVWMESSSDLQVASDATTQSVTINAFVWLENVKMSIPTAELHSQEAQLSAMFQQFLAQQTAPLQQQVPNPAAMLGAAQGAIQGAVQNQVSSAQSAVANAAQTVQSVATPAIEAVKASEQASDGVVSQIASTASGVLGSLSQVPVIGPFAGAAKGVSDVIGSVAGFLGFSRQPILNDAMYIKTRPFTNLALTSGGETVEKFTVDPKQEVSINPAVVGSTGLDELHFSSILAKEAMIMTMSWTAADSPGTEVFAMNVTPVLTNWEVPVWDIEQRRHVVPPISFVALPFKYWSGGMIVRLEIVKSKYHGGRFKVVYEPNGYPVTDEYNAAYTKVVDLAETDDLEFVIPWAQHEAYKEVGTLVRNFSSPLGSLNNYNAATGNGRITMTTISNLMAPVDTAPLYVNIYVRAAEDFEVSVPMHPPGTFLPKNLPPPAQQSGVGLTRAPRSEVLFGNTLSEDEISERKSVFFGESVVSFRPLLKRYTNQEVMTRSLPSPELYALRSVGCARIQPSGYNYRAAGRDALSALVNYNGSVHEWVMNGYCFQRGSIRHKLSLFGENCEFFVTTVSRPVPSASAFSTNANLLGTSTGALNDLDPLANGGTGAVLTDHRIQPTFEVESPFYTNRRYIVSSSYDWTFNRDDASPASDILQTTSWVKSGTNSQVYIVQYSACGDDFSLFNFVGLAPFYDADYAAGN